MRTVVSLLEKNEGYGVRGYFGWMDSGLKIDKKAVKGCILNSRILCFFSNADLCFRYSGQPESAGAKKDSLREYAEWAYLFLREKCIDREKGGVYWSVTFDGEPEDTTKHTYNQAFAVYALSSYFRAYQDIQALELAEGLIEIMETKCFEAGGYKEAMDRDFLPVANEKLSENGVLADRTMNTLLHVMEAYTEYLLACRTGGGQERLSARVNARLRWILELMAGKIYHPELHRQEVFFDKNMTSLVDLHSYGHDIEAAWLTDRCLECLGDEGLTKKLSPVLRSLEKEVCEKAYSFQSLANECERGVVDEKRVWWVQAEGVVGFYNAFQKTGDRHYLELSKNIWKFIRTYLVDKREGGEWFWYTDKEGRPAMDKPIVEPWKCPYHNGRMCMEIISRTRDDGRKEHEVTPQV